MNHFEERILDISKRKGYSHIGSCISVLPILCEIYEKKKKKDIVILDGAHSHVAHLVVREHYEGIKDIESLLDAHGIHCDKKAGCDVSGGSLGHGIGIGIGMAIVNPKRTVHVIVTDGSMMEGSNWEALRIKKDYDVKNLVIYCNFNGFTALTMIDRLELENRMRMFSKELNVYWSDNGKGFDTVEGHYKKL